MQIDIITPDKKVLESEADAVTLPGSKGSFQILKNHADLISTLEEGTVMVKNGAENKTFTISGGVVEVYNNKVIVLAESILD